MLYKELFFHGIYHFYFLSFWTLIRVRNFPISEDFLPF